MVPEGPVTCRRIGHLCNRMELSGEAPVENRITSPRNLGFGFGHYRAEGQSRLSGLLCQATDMHQTRLIFDWQRAIDEHLP